MKLLTDGQKKKNTPVPAVSVCVCIYIYVCDSLTTVLQNKQHCFFIKRKRGRERKRER